MKLQDIADGEKLKVIGSNSKYLVVVEDVSGPGEPPRYTAMVEPVKRRWLRRAAEARLIVEVEALIAERKEQGE